MYFGIKMPSDHGGRCKAVREHGSAAAALEDALLGSLPFVGTKMSHCDCRRFDLYNTFHYALHCAVPEETKPSLETPPHHFQVSVGLESFFFSRIS